MYAIGETFYYEIYDEEYELHVIGDILIGGQEYIIAEDFEGEKLAFLFDENEETIFLVEDEDEAFEIIEHWEEEYFGAGSDIGDWEEDEYYDREDTYDVGDEEEEDLLEENYVEEEVYDEYEEDVDSFITNLMDK